jgi:hypothetical protein
MPLKSFRSVFTVIFLFFFVFTLLPVNRVRALSSHRNSLPSLDAFVSLVKNGQAQELRGIYVPELLAASVVQQPEGIDDFVSPIQNIVTQFDLASQFGSTGLLAHNYLAGERFFQLEKNQKFYLVYGDGKTVTFIVREILYYQALDPTSVSSSFVDLESRDVLTASAVFLKAYNRPGQVTLQTCITRGENLGWGRLFVIAEPYLPDKP